jgi:predicted TIM-barrel fold metal-dependent hydrolase
MIDETVIDADGHVLESMPDIRERLDPRWQREILVPLDSWDRRLRGKLGQERQMPSSHLEAMDTDGIGVMVVFPTMALAIGTIRELDYAVALTQAYNDWVHSFCAVDPVRLHYAALLAPQDPESAAMELRRAVTERGALAGVLPAHVPMRPEWGHRYYDPIFAEAERLDVGLAFHAGTLQDSLGGQRFGSFIVAHVVDHPAEQMSVLASTIVGGVFERFPGLRLAFLEAGVGWVPYLMDRLDEDVEKRGAEEAAYLTRLPSEYITGGQIFFGVECGEKTLPDGVRWGLADTMLYSSDFPHWDGDWPHTVSTLRSREDLSAEVKAKILHTNALRFYGPRLAAQASVTQEQSVLRR